MNIKSCQTAGRRGWIQYFCLILCLTALLSACSRGETVGSEAADTSGQTAQTEAEDAAQAETEDTSDQENAPSEAAAADAAAQEEQDQSTGEEPAEEETEAASEDGAGAGETEEADAPDLDAVISALPDADAAAELEQYFEDKAADAKSAGLTCETAVSLYEPPVLSVVRYLSDSEGNTAIRSETFQTTSAGLYTPADFFPNCGEDTWTGRLTDAVTEILGASDQALYDNWETYAQNAFDRDQFYLTDAGYCVYYQAGVLSASAQEIVIPYETLSDIFVMPE